MPQKNRKQIKFWIRPFGPSDTASALADELGGRRLKLEGSTYRKKNGHVLINWGGTKPLAWSCLNKPEAVRVATSKVATFEVLGKVGVPVPEWTHAKEDAQKWLDKRVKVLGRDLDNGSAGRGITVYKPGEALRDHKFFVKYFKKNRELRIHVCGGKVIFEQEKKKKSGVNNANPYIRSHDRGWCFAFNHFKEEPVPHGVRIAAIAAVKALGLDFGAVDIGWNRDDGPVVFEVNTAPGLENSSLGAYVKAFSVL